MKEFVIDLLKKKISPFYYYHNCEHTLYVLEKVAEIAQQENCSAEEIKLLKTAALWHDIGFINVYNDHEEEGCEIAKKFLPGYGYSAEEINKICGMIMATKIPQSPKNKLEEIIADADLEYLGTNSAVETSTHLFMELRHLNPSLTKEKWNDIQISFLKQHHYFTVFCKKNSEPAKLLYLQALMNNAE